MQSIKEFHKENKVLNKKEMILLRGGGDITDTEYTYADDSEESGCDYSVGGTSIYKVGGEQDWYKRSCDVLPSELTKY